MSHVNGYTSQEALDPLVVYVMIACRGEISARIAFGKRTEDKAKTEKKDDFETEKKGDAEKEKKVDVEKEMKPKPSESTCTNILPQVLLTSAPRQHPETRRRR